MLSPDAFALLVTGFPDRYLNLTILKSFLQQTCASMIHVSTVVEPFFILLSFLLMPSVVPYSQPTTYYMLDTMQLMMFFGEIPRGLNTGRRMYGFSRSTGHRASAIGWYAPLIFRPSGYSFLTALLTGHLGRRTSRYSCNLFRW